MNPRRDSSNALRANTPGEKMPELIDYVCAGKLSLKVKPNASRTEIVSFDPLVISVKEPPEDNRANIELVRYLGKILGKPVRLLVGATSKRKVFKVG